MKTGDNPLCWKLGILTQYCLMSLSFGLATLGSSSVSKICVPSEHNERPDTVYRRFQSVFRMWHSPLEGIYESPMGSHFHSHLQVRDFND